MKLVLTALLIFVSSAAAAESHEEIVARAFGAIETRVQDHWAFTRTQKSERGVYVATHDPRREQPWALLAVDGREPTPDEREDFLSERARRQGDDSDDDSESRSMVSPGSVELIDETDDWWQFKFSPRVDTEDERRFMEAVEGRLEVAKNGHYVRTIQLRNLETIKPGKGARLEVFDTRLEFAPSPDGSAVLPAVVHTKVKGRAMLVVGIDEEQTVEFSDYQRVID